jgi:DNA-binding response OmpR family regulator
MPADPRMRGTQLKGMRVLCIDDDPDILDGMGALLARWGVLAMPARTIAEAESVLTVHRPHVILADYHLREAESGLDLLKRLCAANGACPGALVTANASEALAQAARASGFQVLRKPVKPAALRALLAALVRRQGAGAATMAVAQALDASA